MYTFILTIILFILYFILDCNIDIKINPYLFLILRINKKNQKKLYEILREEFERDDTI